MSEETSRGPGDGGDGADHRSGQLQALAFLGRWVLLALAVVLAAWSTPDVELRDGATSALVVAALIALANVVTQLGLQALPHPDSLLPLALLTLAVNGLAVWVVSAVTPRLEIDGALAAVTFALMVTVFSVGLSWWSARLLRRWRRR